MEILPQLLVNALIQGSIYALASSGLSISYGLLRILNFAHGQILMAGAFIFYLFINLLEHSLILATCETVFILTALSFLTLQTFILPFARYNTVLVFISTLALASVIEAIVTIFFGVEVRAFSNSLESHSYQIGGVLVTNIQMIIICSAFILLGLLGLAIHYTPFGRQIRALSEKGESAEALGINKRRAVIIVYTLGILLAGYSGILIGYESALQPTMGNSYTIKSFAAMVLGGLGNIWGTIAGSYLLSLIENLSIGLDFGGYSLPSGYKDALAFIVILIILLIKPRGLFNSKDTRAI